MNVRNVLGPINFLKLECSVVFQIDLLYCKVTIGMNSCTYFLNVPTESVEFSVKYVARYLNVNQKLY